MTTLPVGWPVGRTLAVSVNVMLEQWADDTAPGLGPMGNPLRAGVLDTQARSWAAYGPETGAWRLLDVLAEARTRATFYVSGMLAERYPPLLRAVAEAGHAIAAHGWSQNVLPVYQTPEAERADLVRSAKAIVWASGVAPRGFISPRCTPSANTASLLAENGFRWHADYFDTDLPIKLPGGLLVAVPFTMEINDLPLAVRYGNEPAAFTVALITALEEGRRMTRPACLDITVHAHVFGRVASVGAFRDALRVAASYHDVAWLTTHADLAEIFA